MSSFALKIVTPDKLVYDDSADKIIVKTREGDVGILARHINYVAALGIGGFSLYNGNQIKRAAISDGFVSVTSGVVTVVAGTFEWADEIDITRAETAKQKAEGKLINKESEHENRLAELKLKKAINRIRIAGK